MKDRVDVYQGDITTLEVDAVVNAANSKLAGGGGVDGAIHRAAGADKLQAACRALGGCPTGEARVTDGFDLPARWIFHAVGPVWRGGDEGEEKLLAACYRTSLQLACDYGARSIAFPAISCGVYGYPPGEAVRCAVDTVAAHLQRNECPGKVIFCCFDDKMATLYRTAIEQL